MARLPPAYCTKIFLQRDYSDGTAVRFQTKFPQELEGKVISVCCYCWPTVRPRYVMVAIVHPFIHCQPMVVSQKLSKINP